MNTILQRAKEKAKKLLTFKTKTKKMVFLMVSAVILSLIIPTQISASGPKFNFLPGDYELLRGANASKGETSWHDPVNASINDAVAMIVYFHNGVVDTTAHNTKIKVVLPQNSSQTLVSQGYLWADNAAQISDTFTINASQKASLEYISGTTKIYKNGSQTGTNLPDGITSANGINIGDINGCWQYSGYVIFQVRVKGTTPDLTIQKTVADSSTQSGSQNWVKEDTANPGDVLAYRLYFNNPGNDTADNVIISDVLPGHVSYILGTTKLYTNATGTSGKALNDNIISSGVGIGDLNPGAGNSGYIIFQAKIDSNLEAGTYVLINTAKIKADNVSEKQDTAKTTVVVQNITPPTNPPSNPPTNPPTVQPVVAGAKALPQTGDMTPLALLFSSLGVGAYYYIKSRKEFLNAYVKSRKI